MMNATKPAELLSEYIELERCKSECEAHLSAMADQKDLPIGIVAMELAAVIRHEERLHALGRRLRSMGVSIPAADHVPTQDLARH